MGNSTKKPAKPHTNFPLFPHASGRWAKKVKGRFHYFGPWADPQAALELWLHQKDDLLAGREPRRVSETGVTLRELVNRFLAAKESDRDTGYLSPRTWTDYHGVCKLLIEHFGRDRLLLELRPEHFEALRASWAKRWGVHRLANCVKYARVIFGYAFKKDMIERPVKFGDAFDKPDKKAMRRNRQAKPPRMFEPEELRRILKAASQPMKAMILLGINCGLGNSDVGQMRMQHINLANAMLDYPRPKTAVERRAPLWPETVEALREWLKLRPAPKLPEHVDLVFLTVKQRGSWHKDTTDNPVAKEMRKLLDSLKIVGNKNFYALRHTTETIGSGAKDKAALDFIMGHEADDMSAHYLESEGISDQRLRAVTDVVHAWLFPAAKPVS